MKTVGIDIDSNEAIIVVLEQDENGIITQVSQECARLNIGDSKNSNHVKQFRDQINASFDAIAPTKIGILSRNSGGGQYAASPLSFKVEGIIQLYGKIGVELVSPQTVAAFLRKNEMEITPKFKYQTSSFNLAYFLLNQ